MNSEQRVIKALRREEIDRVPTFEWSIDKKVINAIYPGASLDEFICKMNIDGIVVEVNYIKEEIKSGVFKDEWGTIERFTEEQHSISEGCIKTQQDFNKYEPPDPRASYRLKELVRVIKKHKGKKAIILHLNDALSIPRNLLGYERLFMNIASNPNLVKKLVNLSVDYNLELAREAVRKGLKIVFTGDDYAYNKGLLISPKSFYDIFYPGFCRVMSGYKELGLYVIKHTDGNIWPIIDKIVDSDIDCLDPIDPTAGMDIPSVKSKYGDRIAIKGNVDCANTLSFGTKADVIKETKDCLKYGAPGWGYILSSSNTIHSGVKPENYIVMLETLKTYGKYPIQI